MHHFLSVCLNMNFFNPAYSSALSCSQVLIQMFSLFISLVLAVKICMSRLQILRLAHCQRQVAFLLFFSAQPITVGWGKKETQFHGSEGKQAAQMKKEVKGAYILLCGCSSHFNLKNCIKI